MYNSGTTITEITEIIYSDRNKQEEDIRDFSNFPNRSYKIENLCLNEMEAIGGDNNHVMFYSKEEIRKLGQRENRKFKDILDLRNKFIVYDIITDYGKHYFGHTKDALQRIDTHDKDEKSDGRNLYEDIRKLHRAIFVPLAIARTEKESLEIEEKYITQFTKKSIEENYPNVVIKDLASNDILNLSRNFCYNISLIKRIKTL